ncbi:YhdP family protein [Gallaecimonas sp. GXIMD4217]|uniref:YhdP family protein n=1 Tax=Gallaecimonas sp. GXIMD4217 TaxID=3131927 RepID=UPI00311ABA97
MTRWLGWLARKTWLLLALTLVLTALAISVARIAITRLDQVRPQLLGWIQAETGLPVQASSLRGSWVGLGPAIEITDLTLADGELLDLSANKVQLQLRFWSSLLNLEPRLAAVEVDGLRLSLSRWPQGTKGDRGGGDGLAALERLFLSQLGRVRLREAELTLPSRFGPRTLVIDQAAWLNGLYRHQGVGTGRVKEYGNQQARFIIDLYGLEDRLSELDGRFFLDGQGLHLDPWINTFLGDTLALDQGSLNARLWVDFEQGQLTGGQLQIRDSQASFAGHRLAVPDLVLGLSRQEQGWQLDSRRSRLLTDDQPWQLGQLQLRRQGDDMLLYIEELALAPLVPVLSLWRPLPEPLKAWLQQASPDARLSDLYLAGSSPEQLALDLRLADLRLGPVGAMPGLEGLSFRASWAKDRGLVRFDDQALQLSPGPHLAEPVTISRLDGDVQLWRQGQDWHLGSRALAIANDELGLVARGNLALGERPGMGLYAEVSHLDVARAYRYLPLSVMPEQVTGYLARALVAGQGRGQVLWQGAFADFPYGGGEGLFLAEARLDELAFAFDEHWPTLRDASLTARFENAAMQVTGHRGRLLEVPMAALSAEIPNLGRDARLLIDASANTTGQAVSKLMRASPLIGVGQALTELVLTGPVSGAVQLDIPLTGGKPGIKGSARLKDNQVQALAFPLEKVSGKLSFDGARLSAKGIRAELYGQPLAISLTSDQRKQGYQVKLDLAGQLMPKRLQLPQTELLSGSSDWQGSLDLLLREQGFTMELALDSSLKGLASQYPYPARKEALESWPLAVRVKGDELGQTLTAELGNRARALAHLKDGQVADWTLAVQQARLPETVAGEGRLAATVQVLEAQEWVEALLPRLGSGQGSFPPLTEVRLESERLLALDQTLNDVTLTATPDGRSWHVKAAAKELGGEFWLPLDWGREPVLVNLSRLALEQWQPSQGEGGEPLQPTDIPPFKLYCGDCRVLGVNLGEVTAEAVHKGGDMVLDKVKQQLPAGRIEAKGGWLADGESHMAFRLEAGNVDDYLQQLGFGASLKESRAKGQASLSWPGAPYDFDLTMAAGTVKVELGKGYVADVSDQGARLLTVFSFDSLRRKLALDFSDLFDEGLHYDKIEAEGVLSNGLLRSEKMRMDGVAGDMEAQGWTDFNANTLAYDIRFYPNVTGNLPVLAAFAVTPITGVAVYALTKIFGPVIDVVTEIRFKLHGPLSAPIMEEVSRKKDAVALPEPPPEPQQEEGEPQAQHQQEEKDE